MTIVKLIPLKITQKPNYGLDNMEYPTCSLHLRGQVDFQVPSLSDSFCASYRSKSQLQDAFRQFISLSLQPKRITIIGQRRDIERVSKLTANIGSSVFQVDTWIPLNTYSTFPSQSLCQKMEGFFMAARNQNEQPVLCMEATELVNRWNREISMGAVMSEWVQWARERNIPMLVLFHHPGIEHLQAISLLQPFSWHICDGKVHSNPYFVPQCPAHTHEPRHCKKIILKNAEQLILHKSANQETLNRIARLIHYYLGSRRVQSVIARLDLTCSEDQEYPSNLTAIEKFPLNFPRYPHAAFTVIWNEGSPRNSDDYQLMHDIIEMLNRHYETKQHDVHFRRQKHIAEKVIQSSQCLVLGMKKDGSLSIISGAHPLVESGERIVQYLPEALVSRARDAFLMGNSLSGHELSMVLNDSDLMAFWVECHPLNDDPFEDYIGLVIIRNITSEKLLRNDYTQLQKQDTVKVMSGGITHDLNNVLSAVMGYASYLALRLSPDDPLREDLSMIEKSTGRAADLVRRLLGYARKSTQPTGLVDPNAILREIARLLEPTLNGSYKLHLQLSDDIWPILGDGNQIQQAIMNLCLNAKSSMARGGEITISTENKPVTGGEPGFKSLKPGLYTVITVSDKGTGIPRKLRKKVFEPFFTTKPVGKGTGLGLTMVKMITEGHGGRLVLRSRKNQGTSLSLIFPSVAKSIENAQSVMWALQRGREGILLVDDEPSIVDMGAKILTNHGYRVYTASSIEEAEKTLVQHIEDINLALLDVILTDDDDVQYGQGLKELSPDLKVVLFSGYPEETFSDPTKRNTPFSYVQKPFNARDLLETVRRTLDGDSMSVVN